MKLIKFLSRTGISSRSQTKKYIKWWYIYVNHDIEVNDENMEVKEWDIVEVGSTQIEVKFEVWVVLHKPAWYVCSRKWEWSYQSIFELLEDCPYQDTLYIAWRLDADTEWLVYLHSDWDMIHRITSPKHNKEKEYLVQIARPISDQDIEKLENWVYIWPEKYVDLTKTWWYNTLPAKVQKTSDTHQIIITITEWKYHQVKRMLEVIDNKVMYLKRLRIWSRTLWDLQIGKRKYEI